MVNVATSSIGDIDEQKHTVGIDQPIHYQIVILRNQRNLFFVLSLGLFVISVLLSTKVVLTSDKTVLIPVTKPEASMVYDSSHIPDEYYAEISQDILHLLLDISPATVDTQFKRLEIHFLPSERENLVHNIRQIKKDVTEKRLSTLFSPDIEEIRILTANREVIVPGTLKTLTYNTVTSEQRKIYSITYESYKGRVYIKAIKEIEPEVKK